MRRGAMTLSDTGPFGYFCSEKKPLLVKLESKLNYVTYLKCSSACSCGRPRCFSATGFPSL
jgi:hypothetical protein